MSWDSKSTMSRRRQNSSAAAGRSRGLSIHMRNASKATAAASTPVKVEPKSAHTSDPFLQEFLSPAFDPAEYLNQTLPPLQGSSSSLRSSAAAGKGAAPLAQLSTEAQELLTQLNAHTTRLATTLTQLTDDIIRSGSRLAYEVELLRGETLGLAETLTECPLKDDLERFVPAGIEHTAASTRRGSFGSLAPATPFPEKDKDSPPPPTPATAAADSTKKPAVAEVAADEPTYISQLRTLTLVRSRLDAVIKTFGDAMDFVFPPSEVSVSSGFLSVSAPDFPDMHTASKEQISTEEKGQKTLRRLRDEISGLLAKGNPDPVKGVEDATKRVEELKELVTVWKGTAEEKARQRFVENLARMVEDRHRELVKEAEAQKELALRESRSRQDDDGSRREPGPGSSEPGLSETRGSMGGYGFMTQWQKLRNGL
ncbi:hypothetical protein KVR01_009775 [Diaporthe batatas]|uniref:uncharacterized protein n=1 Tax=Diaporthe batatas TaxID=748121 RepID=UPI001D03C822|nr:uncharacterized protein KVR01_009775 [Diaporthe batatas]KAG8160239.1 hypothetical protein KVR01_009775 [Diaporthe batatas]